MYNSCLGCFWCEQCGGDTPCAFYDGMSNDDFGSMIREKRSEFFEEYNEYLKEFYEE